MKRLLLACALACWTAPAAADSLLGVVRDSFGNVVGGADFDVFTLDGALLPADDNSDADGTYAILLPAGRYDIVCEPSIASRLAPRLMRGVSVAGSTQLDWVLAPSVRVLGRVRDGAEGPVAGADLDFDSIDDGSRQPALGDLTSSFGTFAAYLEAGAYRVTANPPATVDLAPARIAFVQLPTTDTLQFTLVPAVHLSGTVRDAAGGPIAGARLAFEDVETSERVPSWGHITAADGTFRAGLAPGTYRVLVRPPRGSRLAAVKTVALDLTWDVALDFTLPFGLLVSGRVFDRRGLPLEGADWDVADAATQTSVPTPDDNTDFDGRFAFALPEGIYRMTLNPPLASELEPIVLPDVHVGRDTVIDATYVLPGAGGALLALVPLGSPTHRSALVRLVTTEAAPVLAEIFDAGGRRVGTLVNQWMPAGTYDLFWDGRRANTGVYFVRAFVGSRKGITRFVLLP